jgi:hypothetical protein
MIPHNILSMPLSPRKLGKVSRAVEEFKRYVTELLNNERKLIAQGMRGAD